MLVYYYCFIIITYINNRVITHLAVHGFLRPRPVPSPVFADWPSGRPHVSVENGDRKRNFSKTLSRVEIFENAVFRVCMHVGR